MTLTATIAGQHFTNVQDFEAAAKTAGYKLPRAQGLRGPGFRMAPITKVERGLLGTEVTDGELTGTVWSLGPGTRQVWIHTGQGFALMTFTEVAGENVFHRVDHYIPRVA